MKIYSRERWKAHSARTDRLIRQWPEAIGRVFIHFADMPGQSNTTFDKQAAAARAIQEYHMDDHGWSDIGYHFLVFQRWGRIPSARVFEARPYRYIPSAQAHNNTNTIAICVVMNNDEPLKWSTKRRIKSLLRLLRRRLGHNFVILPHSSVNDTDCPGSQLESWLKTLHI